MKTPLDSRIEARIQELSRRLSDHRKRHGSECHPSREIWDTAIALCERAPVSRVAEGIGVSQNGLRIQKMKAERRPANKVAVSRQPHFFEVRGVETTGSLPLPATPSQVLSSGAESSRQVELQRGDGSRLKIADIGAHGLDVRALIQGFMTSLPTLMQGGRV
jgi:hypothetical protein